MSDGRGESTPAGTSDAVPPDIAARLVRAFDRAPSTVVILLDEDLNTRWISRSARWVTGTDPDARAGRAALETVHPEDVERLIHGMAQLKAARSSDSPGVPVLEPLRYRVRRPDGGWQTLEVLVQNLLDDPEVRGLVLIGRRVGGELDGVGHVVDLLVQNAPLPDVLAACARIVPGYLGSAAVIGMVDGEAVVGAPAGTPAERLAADDRWWRPTLADGKVHDPVDFAGFPDDLAEAGRAEGFRSAWMLPLFETTTREVVGCVAAWVRIAVERNIATNESLRQIERLASLVIGEQRRHLALDREAITDPLTGVGNRSALRRRLDAAAGPVTVALLDLDDFKPVNDTHGHDTGDGVLREIAERIVETVREDDCVVRLGGDEFAVVFAEGTSPKGVMRSAQRIVDAIEQPIRLSRVLEVTVRASLGLATGVPSEVVHKADAALYEAKRTKRMRAPLQRHGDR